MALLSTQHASVTGVALTAAAAAGGGDTFVNTGRESIHVINAAVGSINVTIAAQAACSFGVTNAVHNYVVAVPGGEERRIGPFDKTRFNDADNLVHITYSAVTTVTVSVIG